MKFIHLLKTATVVATAACAAFASNAVAQDVSGAGGVKYSTGSGSVYSNYGAGAFVRGGYAFAGHGGGTSGSASAPMFAAGYRARPFAGGRSSLGIETEIVYVTDSEDFAGVEVGVWGLTGLVSLRWQHDLGNGVQPFISGGVGPAYYRGWVDDGVTRIAGGEWAVGYSGRAGVEVDLGNQWSLEAAYRYLGAARNSTAGLHAGEVGINWNF